MKKCTGAARKGGYDALARGIVSLAIRDLILNRKIKKPELPFIPYDLKGEAFAFLESSWGENLCLLAGLECDLFHKKLEDKMKVLEKRQ